MAQSDPAPETPVLLFDGTCVLCNHAVQFILKNESETRLHFASLQSDLGQRLLREHRVPTQLDSMVLVEHEGGRRATLELCLFAPYGGETEIGVAGSGGRIDTLNQARKLIHHRFDLPERTEMDVADSPDEVGFVDAAGRLDRGIQPEWIHFVECCRTGQQPLTDGASARMSVAVCLAAQQSIRRGEMVTIEEMIASP